MNFYKTIVFICFLMISNITFSQDWETMSDSVYNKIIINRFQKGNVILGLGGALSVHNDYKVIELSFRNQAGYFLKDRWLLNASSDLYLAQAKLEANTKANYNRLLISIGVRRYLKPKNRTFFIEASPVIGFVKENAQEIPEYVSQNSFVYGGKIIGGISVFVRSLEIELSTGLLMFSSDYKKENIISDQSFQINLSYIISRRKSNN